MINFESIAKHLTIRVPRLSSSSSLQYPKNKAISNAASTSINELLLISKNLLRSAGEFLEAPSLIFKKTDIAALRICFVKEYFSSAGNPLVIR